MIDLAHNFIKTWNYQVEGNPKSCRELSLFIPYRLQMLLTSDGSLTRHNRIVNNENMTVEIIREFCYIEKEAIQSIDHTYKKRSVWLAGTQSTRIFAESYWQISQKQNGFIDFTKPIGTELIESEINIRRNLFCIYLGYCHDIEKKFNHTGPLWGRSYKINLDYLSPIFIHEVFSPSLIKTIQ